MSRHEQVWFLSIQIILWRTYLFECAVSSRRHYWSVSVSWSIRDFYIVLETYSVKQTLVYLHEFYCSNPIFSHNFWHSYEMTKPETSLNFRHTHLKNFFKWQVVFLPYAITNAPVKANHFLRISHWFEIQISFASTKMLHDYVPVC